MRAFRDEDNDYINNNENNFNYNYNAPAAASQPVDPEINNRYQYGRQ